MSERFDQTAAEGDDAGRPAAQTLADWLAAEAAAPKAGGATEGELTIFSTLVGDGPETPAPVPAPAAPVAEAAAGAGDSASTVVDDGGGSGSAPAQRESGVSVTAADIRRQWGALSAGQPAAAASVGVRMADPASGRTVELGVALRPGELSIPGESVAAGGPGRDFAIETRLGKGGMGAVYRAQQVSLGRRVAVKVILPEHARSDRGRAKFIAEAVITAALDHPNIIPLHELGVTADGLPFYAMKEVRGTPWSEALGGKTKTEAENVDILLAVADAVAFAHDRGVIHRDLKPENVMLGDYGEVLLMDWGLAVSHYPDENGRPVPKGRAGTPAYMAPEMARADDSDIGPASDIYLLGAILYEITAGFPPHCGQNAYACIAAAANNSIEPCPRDDELIAIARRAMAAAPADRYKSVKDFQAALQEYRRHEESLKIAGHARARLARAREDGSYENFNRAIFGFDEALALWGGNAGAAAARREARLALAREALERGDSDLALSAAGEDGDAEFVAMRERARAQKREQEARRQRVRRWRRLAAAAALAVIAVLSVATMWVNAARARAVEARHDAEEARVAAERSEATAVKALAAETAALEAARKSETEAIAARDEAVKARESESKAKDAELAALREKDAERALREDAQSAARLSEELLARSGYLEDSGRWRFGAEEAAARQEADGGRAEMSVPLPDGAALPLRRVPPGEFVMGSPAREAGRAADEYQHPVNITRGFWLAATPLTRGQWRALVPAESAADLADDGLREILTGEDGAAAWEWRTRALAPGEAELPAVGISLRDVEGILLPRLAARAPAGLSFRLPTEAEWEWACRAGTATPFYSGASGADARRAAWLDENSNGVAHPVGRREPNAWGLYDMHGNVHEIVADFYSPVFALSPRATREDPRNDVADGARPLRVIRGGSHVSLANGARSAKRETWHEDNRHDDVGVRLAMARTE